MDDRSIFLIEDDDEIREGVCELLVSEGYQVQAFGDPRQALDALVAPTLRGPGLILLDLMMPTMSGWDFLEARKALGYTVAAIPVYLLTAAGAAARDVPAEHTLNGVIKKPIDIEQLLGIVEKHCGAI